MDELKSFTILKKGKYGFYKNMEVEGLHNIYDLGDVASSTSKDHKVLHDLEKNVAVGEVFRINSGEKRASSKSLGGGSQTLPTNHKVLHDLGGGSQTLPTNHKVLHDLGEIVKTNPPLKEGLENPMGETVTVKSSANTDDKYTSIQDVEKKYKGGADNLSADVQDINNAGKSGDVIEVIVTLYTFILRDIPLYILSILQLLDFSVHPNIMDIITDAIFKGIEKEKEEGGENAEKDREMKEGKKYVVGFFYSLILVFLVYFATENWFYFLFYKGEDMTNIKTFDEWAKINPKNIVLLRFMNAFMFCAVTLSNALLTLRKQTKNIPAEMAVYLRIALFFALYGIMFNWTSIWNSTVNNYFYVIVMTVFFVLIALYFASFLVSFVGNSAVIFLSLVIAFIVALIIVFLLLDLFGYFDSIAKMIVYLYLVFLSFFYVGYKNGFGNMFRTITEVHNESRILYEDGYRKKTGLSKMFFFVSRLLNEAWHYVCILIIMTVFLGNLLTSSVSHDISSTLSTLIIISIIIFGVLIFFKWINILSSSADTKGEPAPGAPAAVAAAPVTPAPVVGAPVTPVAAIQATNVEVIPKGTVLSVTPPAAPVVELPSPAPAPAPAPVVESPSEIPPTAESTTPSSEIPPTAESTTPSSEIPSSEIPSSEIPPSKNPSEAIKLDEI